MERKKVWASKWNECAYISTQEVKVEHNEFCMVVLVPQIINYNYILIIHTTSPLLRNTSQIYVETVEGLGEIVVGAYPSQAMRFVTNKYALCQCTLDQEEKAIACYMFCCYIDELKEAFYPWI